MKPIFVIRQASASEATRLAGEALGLAIEPFPMWEIAPRSWQAPEAETVAALLIGSANALTQAGEALQAFKGKPVHAVGARTAQIAQAMGFALGHVGTGGLQNVLDALPVEPAQLLRLTGEEHIALSCPPHITIIERVVYETISLPMPEQLADKLRTGAIVLLHSASAAKHLAAEVDRLGLARNAITVACLGPRIAQAAGAGWAGIFSAPQPSDAALLAMMPEMGY